VKHVSPRHLTYSYNVARLCGVKNWLTCGKNKNIKIVPHARKNGPVGAHMNYDKFMERLAHTANISAI
jgi:hypothetical protein